MKLDMFDTVISHETPLSNQEPITKTTHLSQVDTQMYIKLDI